MIAKYTHNAASNLGNSVYATALDASQVQPILDSALKYKLLTQPLVAGEMMQR
jgi:hypothetical protein